MVKAAAKTKRPAKPAKKKAAPKKSTTTKAVHQAQSATLAELAEHAVSGTKQAPIKQTYVFVVGRRKASVARVRYTKAGTGEITINGKPLEKYFPYFEYQNVVRGPLEATNTAGIGSYSVKVIGGGVRGQAESIQLGISRLLLKLDETVRPALRAKRFLSVDARVKERKKYGLKKARRAPQWQKR